MLTASSLRSFLVCATAASLAGCPKSEPQYIVNRSSAPIHVRISQPIREIAPGQRALCEYKASGLRMGPASSKLSSDYADVKLTSEDPTNCEFAFDVPPAYQAIVGDNATCSDYTADRKRYPSMVPSPLSVRIEGVEGVIDLRGWQVARHFRHYRDGRCRLIYE
jgi:hypothetical protein